MERVPEELLERNDAELVGRMKISHLAAYEAASDECREALDGYKSYLYDAINTNYLRTKEAMPASVRANIDSIVQLILAAPRLEGWVSVCHGMRARIIPDTVMVGDVITLANKGFTSSALIESCDIACDHLDKGLRPPILHLLLPPGTPGFYFGGLEEQGKYSLEDENELLLLPDVQYRVVRVDEPGTGDFCRRRKARPVWAVPVHYIGRSHLDPAQAFPDPLNRPISELGLALARLEAMRPTADVQALAAWELATTNARRKSQAAEVDAIARSLALLLDLPAAAASAGREQQILAQVSPGLLTEGFWGKLRLYTLGLNRARAEPAIAELDADYRALVAVAGEYERQLQGHLSLDGYEEAADLEVELEALRRWLEHSAVGRASASCPGFARATHLSGCILLSSYPEWIRRAYASPEAGSLVGLSNISQKLIALTRATLAIVLEILPSEIAATTDAERYVTENHRLLSDGYAARATAALASAVGLVPSPDLKAKVLSPDYWSTVYRAEAKEIIARELAKAGRV